MSQVSSYIQSFQVVGKGNNVGPDGNSLVVDAGWGTEATLEGAVMLKLTKQLKKVRIQVELRGYCETLWESPLRLATKPESETYRPNHSGRIFQQMVQVVYESDQPLNPNPMGNSLPFPFTFQLSKNNFPPTYNTPYGSIQYYIKCTILVQEGMRLLKSNYDLEMPVIVNMPEEAKITLLSSPSVITHQSPGTDEKVGFSVQIPRRILCVGETLEVNFSVNSTPGDANLRLFKASLRTVSSYLSIDNTGARAPIPRPLSEVNQTFPLIRIEGGRPLHQKLFLLVDPEIAQPSLESALISVKTVLRLEIILDNSETPNVHYEVPVVVVPVLKDTSATDRPLQRSKTVSAPSYTSFKPRNDSLRTLYNSPGLARAASTGSNRQNTYPGADGFRPNNESMTQYTFLMNELQAMDVNDHPIPEMPIERIPKASWTQQQVVEWLRELGATADVIMSFTANGVDGSVLVSCSLEDLRDELGVSSHALRRKIMSGVERGRM